MIKIENFEVVGWDAAIRGMRNPMNSWDKSDTDWFYVSDENKEDATNYIEQDSSEPHLYKLIGHNDFNLMMRLRNAGTDHRKFMRMLVVYVDITAPLYWWKEFDTYKVGTVANSCSTMHKIHDKEFTINDFSHEHMNSASERLLEMIIYELNRARDSYIHCKGIEPNIVPHAPDTAKNYWWQMIQLLPSSYNQKRTVMLNYEVLSNIYHSRKNHKLDEWVEFCKFIETLPYSEIITGGKAK